MKYLAESISRKFSNIEISSYLFYGYYKLFIASLF